MSKWVNGVVVANTHWTENLFSLRIEADVTAFQPGQYTELAIRREDGSRHSQPYSILSAPTASGSQELEQKPGGTGNPQTLEFFLYTHLEGELSCELSRLKPGDSLEVGAKPAGTLTLSHIKDTATLCLMATGTGVAPFVSMIQSDIPWQRFDNVVLVYGVREEADLCYRPLFDSLTEQYPGRFSFIPVISREAVTGALRGRIPALLDSGELEQTLGWQLSAENAHIMLCGNPGMVQDSAAVLTHRGFSVHSPEHPGQVSFEAYW